MLASVRSPATPILHGDPISSYHQFDLRDAGELPAGLHFQVALPTPHAAIGGYFVQDWEMLHAAYHDAIVDDISRMRRDSGRGSGHSMGLLHRVMRHGGSRHR